MPSAAASTGGVSDVKAYRRKSGRCTARVGPAVFVLAFLVLCAGVRAQQTPSGLPAGANEVHVTLDHLIERAVQVSLPARLAQAQRDAAQARADQTAANLRPQFTLSATATQVEQTLYFDPYCFTVAWASAQQEVCIPQETVEYDVKDKSGTATLSLRAALWESPLVRATRTLAELGGEAARSEYDAAAQELALQVVDAYYGVLAAEAGVRLAELALEAARLVLAEKEWQEAAGAATPVERLEAQAKVLELEGQLAVARAALRSAQTALNRLAGYPLDTELILTRPVLMQDVPSLEEALRRAADRPDVRSARTRAEQAEANLTLVRAQSGFTLQLFGRVQDGDVEYALGVDRHGFAQLSVTGTRRFDGDEEDQEGPERLLNPRTEGWAVGLNTSWPLWDGGLSAAKVREAEAQAEAARLALELLLTGVEAELRQAWAELEGAKAGLEAARKAAEAMAEAESRMEEMHRMGAASRDQLLQVQLARMQAEQRVLEAEYRYARQRLVYLQRAGLR